MERTFVKGNNLLLKLLTILCSLMVSAFLAEAILLVVNSACGLEWCGWVSMAIALTVGLPFLIVTTFGVIGVALVAKIKKEKLSYFHKFSFVFSMIMFLGTTVVVFLLSR